jgi:hypothetical protein
MTDPVRLSQRSTGLAAELLRAGAEERPNEFGVQQTLLALGLSSVALSATGAAGAAAAASAKLTSAVSASAAAGSVGVASAGTINALSATLIVKWLGIGVLGGVGLVGVAAVATDPPAAPSAERQALAPAPPHQRVAAAPPQHLPRAQGVDSPAAPQAAVSVAPSAPRVAVSRAEPALEAAIPLAAEVVYVDRARALLAAGQSSQGLSLLERYEQEFPRARLLPEVLFLQLEAYERSARGAEARRAAQRLLAGFANSPHAARARKLLEQ